MNYETPEIEAFTQVAAEKTVQFLNQELGGDTVTLVPEHTSIAFKTGFRDGVVVASFEIKMNVALDRLDDLLENLERITTSRALINRILEKTEVIRVIKKYMNLGSVDLSRPDVYAQIMQTPDEVVSRRERTKDLGALLRNNFYGVFGDGILKPERVAELQQTSLTFNIPLAFKRLPGHREMLEHEIEMYREFARADIGTFTAFDVVFEDDKNGAYEVTIFEQGMNTLAKTNNPFRKNSMILEPLLDEMAKMHIKGYVHCDLHYENIGIKRLADKIIVIFDLALTEKLPSRDEADADDIIMQLDDDLSLFANEFYQYLDLYLNQLSPEDKEYAKASIERYFEKIQNHFQFNQADMDKVRRPFNTIFDMLNS